MNLRCKYSPIIKVAITGASGFIGQQLIKVFDQINFESVSIDDLETDVIIIHLAADISNTRSAMLANLEVDTYLLELANSKHWSILYASGNNVYPFALNCCLQDFLLCNTYYDAAKIFGEKLMFDLAKTEVICVRIADVFGSGQQHGNLFKAIEQSIREQSNLQQYGQASKRRSYIHVLELCEILKYLTFNAFKGLQSKTILNLAYADSVTVSDILLYVSKLTGLSINYIPLENDESEVDIRTMLPSSLPKYVPLWKNFNTALKAYIEEIVSETAIISK